MACNPEINVHEFPPHDEPMLVLPDSDGIDHVSSYCSCMAVGIKIPTSVFNTERWDKEFQDRLRKEIGKTWGKKAVKGTT